MSITISKLTKLIYKVDLQKRLTSSIAICQLTNGNNICQVIIIYIFCQFTQKIDK